MILFCRHYFKRGGYEKFVDTKMIVQKIEGEKVGSVHVSMYKDSNTRLPFFFIKADNEDMLQVSYIIEDSFVRFLD